MISNYAKVNSGIGRRNFLIKSTMWALGLSISPLLLSGCSSVPHKLSKVSRGFRAYNGFNPLVRKKQFQTYLNNIVEHKAAWGGTQYAFGLTEPIVAPARGRISFVITTRDYHGLEDQLVLNHGGNFETVLYHIKPRSVNVSVGDIVERGQELAKTGAGLPFKTKMKYWNNIGDMDDYGHNMSYMQFWDGVTQLDRDFDSVDAMSKLHLKLIDEMRKKYVGPGSELFQKTYRGIPTCLNHDSEGMYSWTHAMFFKLMKHIHSRHPELYRGTRTENYDLVQQIHDSQPVVLTHHFKG